MKGWLTPVVTSLFERRGVPLKGVIMKDKRMIKHLLFISITGSLISIVLWILLSIMDPYFEGMNKVDPTISFIMLVLPAVLFAVGMFQQRVLLMIVSFIWSIPYSFFMLLGPKLFSLFGIINIWYLVCIFICRRIGCKYW